MTVRELADLQPVSRPAVSQHLRILESARLVSVEARGNRRLYSIRREGLDHVLKPTGPETRRTSRSLTVPWRHAKVGPMRSLTRTGVLTGDRRVWFLIGDN